MERQRNNNGREEDDYFSRRFLTATTPSLQQFGSMSPSPANHQHNPQHYLSHSNSFNSSVSSNPSVLDLESAFNRFNLNAQTYPTTQNLAYNNTHSLLSLHTPPQTPTIPTRRFFQLQRQNPSIEINDYQTTAAAYEAALLHQISLRDALIQKMVIARSPNFDLAQSFNNGGSRGNRGSLDGIARYNSDLVNVNGIAPLNNGFNNGVLGEGGIRLPLREPSLEMSNQLDQLQYLENVRVEDLRGVMALLAKDQNGSRVLQKKIEEGRVEDIELIFLDVKDCMAELMVDKFGNYLVQKLLDLLNEEQRSEIIVSVTRSDYVLVKICQNTHGTRAMQNLLEHLTTPQQLSRIIEALIKVLVPLTKDLNGHHIIQHCVKYFSREYTEALLEAVAANCVPIAVDRYGCCVLQSCVDHAQGQLKEHFVDEIIRNAAVLANDPYGNYVVQHILELKIPQATAKLLRMFHGQFVTLSTQKFSSNVVEKCLKESSMEQSMQIMEELVNIKDMLPLLQDAFGNYVIQTLLAVASKTPMFNSIVECIKIHYSSLRSHPYGKRIIEKIDELKKQQACILVYNHQR